MSPYSIHGSYGIRSQNENTKCFLFMDRQSQSQSHLPNLSASLAPDIKKRRSIS